MTATLESFGTIDGDLDNEGTSVRTHDQLPEHEYHARPEWSKSQFALLPDEPELFYGRHVLKLPDFQQDESPQMRLGTAVHEAVLLGQDVKIIPESVLTSNGQRRGKAWQEFEREHLGETWLRDSEAEPKRAVDAVRRRRYARKLLEAEGQPELSLFWTDELTSLRIRGRLDRYCKIGNGIILDLKTTSDPTPDGFPWKCLDYGYDTQAACYMYGAEQCFGVRPDAFVFVAVEVQSPYRCRVYEADETKLLYGGWDKYVSALADLKFRLESGIWESPDADAVHNLRIPARK